MSEMAFTSERGPTSVVKKLSAKEERWICASIKPGIIVMPRQSTILASPHPGLFNSRSYPALDIFPPRISTRFARGERGSRVIT
jgi:hypothetical protein